LCYTPTAPRILLELCSRPPHLPHSTFLLLMMPRPPSSTLFPYTTLFRSISATAAMAVEAMRVMIQRAARSMALRRRSREPAGSRSEEHTSELQSRENLVCRLLLEKKKQNNTIVLIVDIHAFPARGPRPYR